MVFAPLAQVLAPLLSGQGNHVALAWALGLEAHHGAPPQAHKGAATQHAPKHYVKCSKRRSCIVFKIVGATVATTAMATTAMATAIARRDDTYTRICLPVTVVSIVTPIANAVVRE